jgi:hypothetical protein
MPRSRTLIAASACLALCGVPAAWAHPLDLALINLESRPENREGAIHVTVEVNPAAAEKAGEGPLSNAVLSLDGHPCAWGKIETTLVSAQNLSFSADVRCPEEASGSLELKLPFLAAQGRSYRAIFLSRVGGTESVGDAVPERPWVRIELRRKAPSIAGFVGMGVEHIGATPGQWSDGGRWHLPEGIDHVLFVVALVLAGGSMLNILKTVSGFTVGHSITLALGTFGLLQIPSRIVESAIALSIAVVAVEGMILKASHARWKLSLAFGLVHGLGFASALTDLHLGRSSLFGALLGFNLGVELGQAVVVAAVFPLLLLLKQGALTRRLALPACSIAVFLTGSVWFIQRAWPG